MGSASFERCKYCPVSGVRVIVYMSRAKSEVAQCKNFLVRPFVPKLRNYSGIAPPCSRAETEVAHFRNTLWPMGVGEWVKEGKTWRLPVGYSQPPMTSKPSLQSRPPGCEKAMRTLEENYSDSLLHCCRCHTPCTHTYGALYFSLLYCQGVREIL